MRFLVGNYFLGLDQVRQQLVKGMRLREKWMVWDIGRSNVLRRKRFGSESLFRMQRNFITFLSLVLLGRIYNGRMYVNMEGFRNSEI